MYVLPAYNAEKAGMQGAERLGMQDDERKIGSGQTVRRHSDVLQSPGGGFHPSEDAGAAAKSQDGHLGQQNHQMAQCTCMIQQLRGTIHYDSDLAEYKRTGRMSCESLAATYGSPLLQPKEDGLPTTGFLAVRHFY